MTHTADLPQISVVFIFVNEALSVILRSVHSVVNRTPSRLLKEVILVDDNSDSGEWGLRGSPMACRSSGRAPGRRQASVLPTAPSPGSAGPFTRPSHLCLFFTWPPCWGPLFGGHLSLR